MPHPLIHVGIDARPPNLCRFFRGVGEAVEFCPWPGCSTCYIVTGLAGNPNFVGRKRHVCDNFVWRADWMDNWVDPADRPDHLADFRHLFDRYAACFAENLVVQKRIIAQAPDNIGVADLAWAGRSRFYTSIAVARWM